MISINEIDEFIRVLEELKHELKWAERDPEDKDPTIEDPVSWKNRILEAREKRPKIEEEVGKLLEELSAKL